MISNLLLTHTIHLLCMYVDTSNVVRGEGVAPEMNAGLSHVNTYE